LLEGQLTHLAAGALIFHAMSIRLLGVRL